MKPVDLVLGGGGSLLPAILAAAYAVHRRRDIQRVAGTSAGSIAAAALAFSMPAHRSLAFCDEFLHGDRLLDASLWPLDRWGIYSGDVMHRALREVFPGRMGDAHIPLSVVVSDLWTRRPLTLTSKEHPAMPVADALRASCSIPVFFKAARLGGDFGSRTFVDGGVAMNYAMDAFDDDDRPTIGVRVCGADDGAVVPVRSLSAFATALAQLLTWASDHAHLSAKPGAQTIDIPTAFDGLDFDLTQQEVAHRWAAGNYHATAALGAA